jgi:tyrosinase
MVCFFPLSPPSRHRLSDHEKKSYIDATVCLMTKPATQGFPDCTTRWDELTYVHRVNTNIVHNVGALLPWHRYYTYLHEQLLRTECGYTGAQPYWETVLDVGDVLGSVILDPVTGFGGNGTGADLCVPDGPFANITLHLGPKYTATDHCISRNVDELVAVQNCSQTNIDALFNQTLFEDVYDLFGNTIHTGGHSAIGGSGGVMTDLVNSPGGSCFPGIP